VLIILLGFELIVLLSEIFSTSALPTATQTTTLRNKLYSQVQNPSTEAHASSPSDYVSHSHSSLDVGRKTHVAIRPVVRASDGFEPFLDVLAQADKQFAPSSDEIISKHVTAEKEHSSLDLSVSTYADATNVRLYFGSGMSP
jgi:hypothetical protein